MWRISNTTGRRPVSPDPDRSCTESQWLHQIHTYRHSQVPTLRILSQGKSAIKWAACGPYWVNQLIKKKNLIFSHVLCWLVAEILVSVTAQTGDPEGAIRTWVGSTPDYSEEILRCHYRLASCISFFIVALLRMLPISLSSVKQARPALTLSKNMPI